MKKTMIKRAERYCNHVWFIRIEYNRYYWSHHYYVYRKTPSIEPWSHVLF